MASDDAAPLGTVRTLALTAVRPSPDNPRKVPAAAVDIVAKSIAEFGWQQPLVIDVDHVLIVGHTRLLAAKKLGLATVPVIIADHLTPQQVRAYRIADNRAGDFTSWDFPELARQLDELSEDFSEVLALANWQSIIADYDQLITKGKATGTSGEPDGPTDPWEKPWNEGSTDEVANYLSGDFTLTVVCDSKEHARTVAAHVIDLPGVIDVRDKR